MKLDTLVLTSLFDSLRISITSPSPMSHCPIISGSSVQLPWDSLARRHINFSIRLLTCPAVWSKFTNLASWIEHDFSLAKGIPHTINSFIIIIIIISPSCPLAVCVEPKLEGSLAKKWADLQRVRRLAGNKSARRKCWQQTQISVQMYLNWTASRAKTADHNLQQNTRCIQDMTCIQESPHSSVFVHKSCWICSTFREFCLVLPWGIPPQKLDGSCRTCPSIPIPPIPILSKHWRIKKLGAWLWGNFFPNKMSSTL